MKAAFALVALVALAVSGCAPESGTVVRKRSTPASSWTSIECSAWHRTTTTYRSGGKTRTRSYRSCVAWRPRIHYSPARWYLTLDDGDDRGERAVSPAAWQKCGYGARYPGCARSSW